MKKFPNEHVDLIYLDPPFNSNRSYNLLYKNRTNYPVPEQVEAFCDTWEMDAEKQGLMDNMVITMRHYEMDKDFIDFWDIWTRALRRTQPKLLAYLLYMTPRLLEMRRILKRTGSIYLHCDPTASHYIKIIMDGIFGSDNFKNELVWCYAGGGIPKNDFPRKHDIVFRYTRGNKYFFKREYKPYGKHAKNGKRATDLGGKRKIEYRKEGTPINDWWVDIKPLINWSSQKLGYPTQKPTELLNRIINASCPDGGVILDPFCGCGTTIYSAHLNNRRWVGIDIAIHATNLIKDTLYNRYQLEEGKHYKLDGAPVSVEEAKHLMKRDAFQFEKWAVELVKGFCTQKTNDKGIDGSIYFKQTYDIPKLGRMVLSVKGGKAVNPAMVRDLKGVMEREKSEMAGLILLTEPTRGMIEEASRSGYYELQGIKYPKCQILTIRDILENKKLFHIPNMIGHREKTDDLYMSPDVKPVKSR